MRGSFTKTEELPNNISDLVSSDICGPFKASIDGYQYFITWINHCSHYVNVNFLKKKECTYGYKLVQDIYCMDEEIERCESKENQNGQSRQVHRRRI